MLTIKGKKNLLRSALLTDVDLIVSWENNKKNWNVSNTITPYSKPEILNFISAQTDIYSDKQLRLMICLAQKNIPVGCIDIFDYNEIDECAGVGIFITEPYRKQGIAFEALQTLCSYCNKTLQLKNIYSHVHADNIASVQLFKKSGFTVRSIENNVLLLELSCKNYD